MAPLPQNNTARVWVDYSDQIHTHTMMWRFGDGATNLVPTLNAMADYLTALSPVLYELSILGARWANDSVDNSNPVVWPGDPTYGTGAATAVGSPVEIRYEGRSFGGRKVHTSLYGYKAGVPGTFRIPITVGSELDDALVVLAAASAADRFIAIDGGGVNFKTYVNIQYNSYWERKQRP